MAQRISRAKAKVKASGEPFMLPSPDQHAERLRSVLHVLYLLFNEGYATSSGPDLARTRSVRRGHPPGPGRARGAARRRRGGRPAGAHAAHRRPTAGPHRRRR